MAERWTIGSGLYSDADTWYGGQVPDPAVDTIAIGPEIQVDGPHIVTLDVDLGIVLGGDAPFNLRDTGWLVIPDGRTFSVSPISDTEIDGLIELRAGGRIVWNDIRCHAGHVGRVRQRSGDTLARYGAGGFRIVGPQSAGGGGRRLLL